MIIENIDKEITLCYTSKIDDNSVNFFLDVDLKYIQFHFCIDGNASFSYNNDSYKLNFYLSEMVNSNVEYCFMEVSSHSIDQERISNLDYNYLLKSYICKI